MFLVEFNENHAKSRKDSSPSELAEIRLELLSRGIKLLLPSLTVQLLLVLHS
jgi:hypothetical protein